MSFAVKIQSRSCRDMLLEHILAVIAPVTAVIAPSAVVVALLRYGPDWIDAVTRFRLASARIRGNEPNVRDAYRVDAHIDTQPPLTNYHRRKTGGTSAHGGSP
jgi:hypothetical protein